MPYLSTRSLIATYQPLAQALGKTLHRPVQPVTAPDFPTFLQRVGLGDYDLVLLAPHFAQLAIRDFGYQPLLTHREPIRVLLVAARVQPLAELGELKNQTIAIVDRSAAVAIAGVTFLAGAGLQEDKDYVLQQTTTHSSALHSLLSGQARAAIVSAASLQLAAPEVQRDVVIFREIARLPGQFYLAHNRLTPNQLAALRAALLRFEKTAQGDEFFARTGHGGFREPLAEEAALLDRLLPETRRQLGLAPQARR